MNLDDASGTLALIGPVVLGVFGLAFVWVWSFDRRRQYLLTLTLTPNLFALGVLTQLFQIPNDPTLNAAVSGLLYAAAVLLISEAVLRRWDRSFGLPLAAALIAASVAFSLLIAPDSLLRMYAESAVLSTVLVVTGIRLADALEHRFIDRTVFWVGGAFVVQFISHTMVAIEFAAPGTLQLGRPGVWALLHVGVAVVGTVVTAAVLAAALGDVIDDLRTERDEDVLTGVLNRRAFELRAGAVLRADHDASAAVIVVDLDRFKDINDRFGHAAGDEVLNAVGMLLKRSVRAGDLVGRLGGDEFAVVIRISDGVEAYTVAERIRREIEAHNFAFVGGTGQVTATLGVGEVEPGDTLAVALERADRGLYRAKAAGRNQTDGTAAVSTMPAWGFSSLSKAWMGQASRL